jgi:hypothetical protein
MQASKGDNATERPMWAEKGGLDFDGRAKWDAWAAVKGAKADKAKLNFVKVGSPSHVTFSRLDHLVFSRAACSMSAEADQGVCMNSLL